MLHFQRLVVKWLLLGALLAVMGWGPPLPALAAQEHGEPGASELRQQLKQGWQALRKMDESRQTYLVELNELSGLGTGNERRLASVARVKIDWQNGCRLIETVKGAIPDRYLVYGRNRHYAFFVLKEGNRSWRLQRVENGPPESNGVDGTALDEYNREYLYPLSSTCWGACLTVFVDDQHFAIESIKRTSEGKLLVGFRYKRQLPAPAGKWLPVLGEFVADPARHHVVERWTLFEPRTQGGRTVIRTVSRSVDAGVGQEERLVCRTIKYEGGSNRRSLNFTDFDRRSFSSAPFRLTHYGLPEPIDVPPAGPAIPRSVWFLLAGIVALSLGGVVHWVVRRRKSRSTA